MAATENLSPEQLAVLMKQDQNALTRTIVVAFTVLAFISVCLRIFTRLRYQAAGWEDHSIVVAMVRCIRTNPSQPTAIFQVLQANAGSGKHTVFIPYPEGIMTISKNLFWSIIFYNLALMFIKVSIILQYQRIFTLREMRLPLQLAMGICVGWGIATFFTSVFTCVPVAAYWRILEKANATCMRDEDLWFSNAAINIFTDLMVAVLPVKVIWGLHIPRNQKIALVGILTIGWFVCVVSVLRLHGIIVLFQHPDDRIYYSAAAAYWSSIEMNLGIVCASLPALKPLLVKIIPGFSTRHSSRGYGAGLSGALGSKSRVNGNNATRTTTNDDVELAFKINTNAYSSRSDQDTLGKSIYVTQHFQQHYEKNAQISDSESQKDLVVNTTFSAPYAQH
ncbi:hypothetical protein EK21DRAFT_98141 [Setomelanomma holmii]|uniref:Rhodopsin domain-containing protein n=1 Tax=Setomelanomma holmii TaxID=210430 RepID=A0A9P4LQN3_9PLEO|nr:hypothetical protein EK21DRAFT_98141 [Setomelanomma holmii]